MQEDRSGVCMSVVLSLPVGSRIALDFLFCFSGSLDAVFFSFYSIHPEQTHV